MELMTGRWGGFKAAPATQGFMRRASLSGTAFSLFFG